MGATVIDTRDGSQRSVSVVVDGDRIVSTDIVDPAGLSDRARIIDARGMWIVPGFVVFKALVSQAQARDMRVYVHTAQLAAAAMAFDTGVDALLHGTMDGLLREEDLQRLQAAETVWVPTNHALYWFGDHARYAKRVLEDPRFLALMDEVEREQFRAQAESDAPILVVPSFQFLVDHTAAYIGMIEQNTKAIASAGIPIAVGSDGGPGGVSTHMEMQLLQTHGLSATEVLAAATYGGALALDRAHELGVVDAGRLADFVVLDADPREKIANAREIVWVVKGGVAYTPQELAGM